MTAAETVDGKLELERLELLCRLDRALHVVHGVFFGDVDDQPRPFVARRPVRLDQVFYRHRFEGGEGNIDRERQMHAELGEIGAGLERAGQRKLRQLRHDRVHRAGQEGAGQHDAVLWMAGAGESFGAGEPLLAQVDFRLIPEFDPVVGERFLQIEARRDRRRQAELELVQDLDDGVGLERLLQHRQHGELVLQADCLDVIEHGCATIAHQLHRAGEAVLAELDDRFDRIGRFERDVEEHELRHTARGRLAEGRAVGELDGVDPRAVQHQRQEMAEARLFVDDVAERHGAGRKRGRLDGSGSLVCGRLRRRHGR